MKWQNLNLRIHQIFLALIGVRLLALIGFYLFSSVEDLFYQADKVLFLSVMMFFMAFFDRKKNIAKYQICLGVCFLLEFLGSKFI